MAAPVLPAVMNPAALPSRTRRSPTRSVESRLARTACAAFSFMPITSLAWTTCDLLQRRGGVVTQFGADLIFRPDQQNVDVVVTRGQDRAFDFRFRRAIRAHGVDGDDRGHESGFRLQAPGFNNDGALSPAAYSFSLMARTSRPL